MSNHTPTPHNGAQLGEIASTVLMAGDPLRAKFIADSYLEEVVQYNGVRNMLGYTGRYKGKLVSVQGHGMGIPSIGIYTHELFHFYGVERIIRVGSAGCIQPHIQLGDVIIAMAASTDSAFTRHFGLPGDFSPIATFHLLEKAVAAARAKGIEPHVGNILSSDIFYNASDEPMKKWASMGILAVEMEATALYSIAAAAGKEALCIVTASDKPLSGEALSPEDRQTGLRSMIEVALKLI